MSVLNGILLWAALTDTVSTGGCIFVIKHLYLGTRFTAVYRVYGHPSITAHYHPNIAPPVIYRPLKSTSKNPQLFSPWKPSIYPTTTNRCLPETEWYRVFLTTWPISADPTLWWLLPLLRSSVSLPSSAVKPPRQWRTEEFFSGVFNKFSLGQRTERTGIWSRSPLVRSSGGSCNLVQEISFLIVKFS